MKKIIVALICIISVIIPNTGHAAVTYSSIQKDLVMARYEVTKLYGLEYNKRIDSLFIKKILSNDIQFFETFQNALHPYFSNKKETDILTKKETLYKYLYIRSIYELRFRK
ncbi:hypothetical protein N8455_00645 [Candidatus Gracilibacteria bacterium]|nr:hypothetical protein [Candidatus Gracilibacteria bacterium]